jgi:chloramphenicol 3-O-phosphotransferase
MNQVSPHTTTRAIVVRAGYRRTLVALPQWLAGQVLVPVETWIIMAATRKGLEELPGLALWVKARLDAKTEFDLALQEWSVTADVNAEVLPSAGPIALR